MEVHSYQAGRDLSETKLRRYRYTGKERDEESGFYYYGSGSYASWLGRWVSTDPAGLADGPNLYAYVCNDPIKLMDPNGRQSDEDILGRGFAEMGSSLAGLIEMLVGGQAQAKSANEIHHTPAEGGVGGMVGGLVQAATVPCCSN